MATEFTRKDFFTLAITFTALGAAAACGDENDTWNDVGGGGKSGNRGNGGAGADTNNGGGTESGGTSAGKAGGGTETGGNNLGGADGVAGTGNGGKTGSGQAGDGSSAGNSGGGDGASYAGAGNTGGAAGETGETGTAGQGGHGSAGESGSGGEGGAGGAGGRNLCGSATLAQTAGPNHDHIPDNPTLMFASFTALVDGSNPTATFALPIENAHSHNITLTTAQVARLRAGMQVVGKLSTLTNEHMHTYTIFCG